MPANPAQICFDSPAIAIGTFRCGPEDPAWRRENNIGPWALFAFPLTAVRIRHRLVDVIATPTIATLYNPLVPYEREIVSPLGDRCEWFAFDPTALLGDRGLAELELHSLEQPFTAGAVPCESSLYLLQRGLFGYVSRGAGVDPLQVEELFLSVLSRLARSARRTAPLRARSQHHRTRVFHRACVEHIQRRVGRRPAAEPAM